MKTEDGKTEERRRKNEDGREDGKQSESRKTQLVIEPFRRLMESFVNAIESDAFPLLFSFFSFRSSFSFFLFTLPSFPRCCLSAPFTVSASPRWKSAARRRWFASARGGRCRR